MISFDYLGRMGRLGNQMFQYAALLGIAEHRYNVCIPNSVFQNPWEHHQLFQTFNLQRFNHIGTTGQPVYHEPHFHYCKDWVASCPDNHDLRGFFQSEKYFIHIADIIRTEYSWSTNVKDYCYSALENLLPNLISLHVRRTDYTNLDHHPLCSIDYYTAALNLLPQTAKVLVFSDDIAWCKNVPLFQHPRFYFSESNDNVVDMCLMSMCDHHIIANSSFSWWGAWLGKNPDKIIIAPSNWFGQTGYTQSNDTQDLYPNDWKVI